MYSVTLTSMSDCTSSMRASNAGQRSDAPTSMASYNSRARAASAGTPIIDAVETSVWAARAPASTWPDSRALRISLPVAARCFR